MDPNVKQNDIRIASFSEREQAQSIFELLTLISYHNIMIPIKHILNCIIPAIVTAIICIYSFSASGSAISNVILTDAKNAYACTYQEQTHNFLVYLPENYDTDLHPLVIMLHGYGNTAQSFAMQTHFEKDACKEGYVVTYVSSTPDSRGYIGWNSGLDNSDKDDVGFIINLASYLQTEYNCDPRHTFVVGFSNGAFMTQRLAVDAPESFRGVVSVAGMMPEATWLTRKEATEIGVLEIYGTKDDVIPKRLDDSYKTAKAPAIEDVMSNWALANNLQNKSELELSPRAICTQYTNSEKTNHVWTVVVDEGRHSWYDEAYAGFNINKLILNFFDAF